MKDYCCCYRKYQDFFVVVQIEEAKSMLISNPTKYLGKERSGDTLTGRVMVVGNKFGQYGQVKVFLN